MEKAKIDFCALSETKKKGNGSQRYQNYILFYSGVDKNLRARGGVGLLINKRFEMDVREVEYISQNILKVTIELANETTHMLSIYAPDISKAKEDREEFFDTLQSTLDKIPSKDKIFIMGDYNSRIGKSIIPGIMHSFNEEAVNDNGDMLIDICAHNELRINNTYFNHKEQQKFTFVNTRGQKSIIDYVITNRRVHPSHIMDVRVLTSANIGTQHGLVLCKYRISHIIKKRKIPNYETKFNIESLADESTKHLYQRRLYEKIAQNPISETDDVEVAWEKLKNNIKNSAKESLGERTTNTNRTNNKPWFSPEIKELANEKKDAYLKYINNRTREEYEAYKRVRNRTTNAIKDLKRTYWENFSLEMEYDLHGGQKKIWSMLRKRKKPINEEVVVNVINQETWISHFENLYDNNENNIDLDAANSANLPSPPNEQEETFTLDDVQATMKKLKNRKSPGTDNIPNELLKNGGLEIERELTKLYRKIEKTGLIPAEWRTSITIPIYKKGLKSDPKNYRGITLLSSVLKLFTKILANKITSKVNISEEQQGFRPNRSTIDAIFILRQLIEKSMEYNKPMYICFVDLQQAFDRVKLDDVIWRLNQKGVNENYIKLVKELNTNSKTRIKTECGLTKEIKIQTGIRQGDSLSPCLFNLIMDQIIESVNEVNAGFRMNDRRLRILCYADDAILIAENEDDLQRLLHKFNITAQRLNMKISCEKTQSMVISKDPIRCKLVVDERIIDQVMNFHYLGVETSSSRSTTNEVDKQVKKAARISGYLREVIWKNKYMSTESKTRIYKTCIRPILTYAAETRAETTETKRKMRTTEMKILRTIKGTTLRDRIRNIDTLTELGVQDVVRWVRARRRYWRDHVERMDPERIAKWAKTQIPNTRRPVGRPPKRWHDSWTSASQEG